MSELEEAIGRLSSTLYLYGQTCETITVKSKDIEVILDALDNSIPREVVEMTLERLEREKVKAIENDDFISVSNEGQISLCKELLEKSQLKVK